MSLKSFLYCFGAVLWILSLAHHTRCSADDGKGLEKSPEGIRKEYTIIENVKYEDKYQVTSRRHRLYLLMQKLLSNSFGPAKVKITTSKGPIVGLRRDPNPLSGASYDAFLGIPYGKIPARFKPAIPREKWTTPLITQKDGPPCPQSPRIPSKEDCLYLNVFTPVKASSIPGKLPVMAYIHGSAFIQLSAYSLVHGPDFIVPQGVILVMMNYRLGAAGFLTLGSSEAPGNLGLLDTQLALKWIQEEISVFGGDPGRVTLAGWSTGAVMTMFHYLSPVSSAMFQRAIAHSGSAWSTYGHVTAAEAVRRAKLLADAVRCDTTLENSQILTCLQQKDIETIVQHQMITLPVENRASGDSLPFVPVIDTHLGNTAFFPDSIENLLKAAVKRSKPLMTGFTTEDGISVFELDSWNLVERNLKSFIPLSIKNDLSVQQKFTLGEKIKSKYFPDTVDQNKVLDVMYLYTDYMFAYPAIEVIRQLSHITYAYVFAYDGAWAPIPKFFKRFHITGVNHGDDLRYLFGRRQDLSTCTTNQPNLVVRDNMVRWWTNFIKGEEPDPTGQWTTADKGHYLLIDSTASLIKVSEVEDKHYNFWANLNAADLPSS